MDSQKIVESLVKERAAWPHEDISLVLLVMDGVGDVRHPDFEFKTPLEVAATPNLDALAQRSALGRIIPVERGITPGSGPAHLGLFGYDPREVEIGRGVLEALGLDMDLRFGDVAARVNFCTIKDGVVTDRRAGRPATEVSAEKCELLQEKLGRIEDVDVIIRPGKGHRFAVIFRGPGLAEGVSDTDPHENNEPVRRAEVQNPDAEKTARKVRTWLRVPLIPDYNDSESHIRKLAEFGAKIGAEKICLLPYHRWGEQKYERLGINYAFKGTPAPTDEHIQSLSRIIEHCGLEASIGK